MCNIVSLLESDVPAVLAIANEYLGEGYYCVKPNSEVLVAKANGQVVGFIEFSKISETQGEMRSIVVAKSHRHHGIAHDLVRMSMDSLKNAGVKEVSVPAWHDGNSIPAEALLLEFGFHKGHAVPNYWLEDSMHRKFECVICGNPCYCSAVMFEKSL